MDGVIVTPQCKYFAYLTPRGKEEGSENHITVIFISDLLFHMSILLECMYVHLMCLVPSEVQRRQILWDCSYRQL